MFANILCAVDFSVESEGALAAALALARATLGHVTILTVVDPLLYAGAAAAGAANVLDTQTQLELRQMLERASAGAPLPGMPAIGIRVGKPFEEILAQAVDCGADVIVMGTRGLGGAGKLLLGSTSRRVLERATVPVMVVPPDRR